MISQEETIELEPTSPLVQRRAFLKLPIEERRKILAEQAELLAQHYEAESEKTEREHWQGGDIVE